MQRGWKLRTKHRCKQTKTVNNVTVEASQKYDWWQKGPVTSGVSCKGVCNSLKRQGRQASYFSHRLLCRVTVLVFRKSILSAIVSSTIYGNSLLWLCELRYILHLNTDVYNISTSIYNIHRLHHCKQPHYCC